MLRLTSLLKTYLVFYVVLLLIKGNLIWCLSTHRSWSRIFLISISGDIIRGNILKAKWNSLSAVSPLPWSVPATFTKSLWPSSCSSTPSLCFLPGWKGPRPDWIVWGAQLTQSRSSWSCYRNKLPNCRSSHVSAWLYFQFRHRKRRALRTETLQGDPLTLPR